MPNITVNVSQSVYTDARIFAAQKNTSVSAIVKSCLQNLRSLNFNPGPGIVMLCNRQSKAAAVRAREQAARAARLDAFQAVAKAAQSSQN